MRVKFISTLLPQLKSAAKATVTIPRGITQVFPMTVTDDNIPKFNAAYDATKCNESKSCIIEIVDHNQESELPFITCILGKGGKVKGVASDCLGAKTPVV